MEKRNQKGFTLAELLIVVAIIAVLTAIAIPVFSNSLEKSKEATDLANLRAAYAEAANDALLGTKDFAAKSVAISQSTAGFLDSTAKVGNVPVTNTVLAAAKSGDTLWVCVDKAGNVAFTASKTEPTAMPSN